MIPIKSVKEMSNFTGVSVRTLHYYDEIGLLPPAYVTPAGYRQYCTADIVKLQKILLLKEVGLSLSDIKKIIMHKNPDMQKFIFEKQLEILSLKKRRIDELIEIIHLSLKGENIMTFENFNTEEIKRVFDEMLKKLNDKEKSEYIQRNGGNLETAEQMFASSFEKYNGDLKYFLGDKEMDQIVRDSPSSEQIEKSREILSCLYKQLGQLVSHPIDETVEGIFNEIYTETISMFPIEKQRELFLEMAELYAKNEDAAREFDNLYGTGTANYFLKCVNKIFK